MPALQGQLHQPCQQIGVGQPAGLPQLGVHGNGRKAGQGVEFVDQNAPIVGEEKVHPGHAVAFQGLESPQGQLLDTFLHAWRQVRGNDQFRPVVVQVLGGVGIEPVPGPDFPRPRGLGRIGFRVPAAQHRAFHLPPFNLLFHDHLFAVGKRIGQRPEIVTPVFHAADPHRRPQRGGLDEQGQAQPGSQIREAGPGFGEGMESLEGRHRQAGLGQQALHHVLVHAHGGTQHVRAHVGQPPKLQHALQGAVLAVGAVNDGQEGLDGGLFAQVARRHQHAFTFPGGGVQGNHLRRGRIDADAGRVVGIQQERLRLAHMPAAGLVDGHQQRLEALPVQRPVDAAGRAQGHLVFAAASAAENAQHQFHRLDRLWKIRGSMQQKSPPNRSQV